MPVKPTDVQFYLTSGGKVTTNIGTNQLHAVFPEMTGSQQRSGFSDLKMLAIVNKNPTVTFSAVKVFFQALDTGGALVDMCVDPQSATQWEQKLTTGDVGGFTWVAPTIESAALSIGNLGPMQARGLWLRRRSGGSLPARFPQRTTLQVFGTTPT